MVIGPAGYWRFRETVRCPTSGGYWPLRSCYHVAAMRESTHSALYNRTNPFDRRLRRRLRIPLFAYRWLARRADAAALKSDPKTAPGHSWKYLLPDERLIRAQRLHIAALMKPFALLFCCLLAAGTLSVVFPQRLTLAVIWAAWVALLLRFGWRIAEWSSKYIVVTNTRLFVQSGVLTRTINMLPPNAVRDMYFERSLMGCALGYGKFSIACWIPGGLHLRYLARPEQLHSDMVSMAMPKESVRQA